MTLAVDIAATFTADGAEAFTVDAALEVDPGETLVVLGPSGSGKTLLLETVAGFHPHDGCIGLDGVDIGGRPPERRDFGFVFQDYALFPHMTVRENVVFGARYRESTRDPDALLAELGVADLVDRRPPTLSGGEQQRVALARSLCVRPEVLLLDEPLSSLDVPTRQALRDDLLDVLSGVTAVYVTHNRTTARALGDRIAVMHDGRIVQEGPPAEVFEEPASPFVASFTGSNCLRLDDIPAVRESIDVPGSATHLAIRPEYVDLHPDDRVLTATVERVAREDAAYRVTLGVNGATLEAFASEPPEAGAEIEIGFKRDRIVALRSG